MLLFRLKTFTGCPCDISLNYRIIPKTLRIASGITARQRQMTVQSFSFQKYDIASTNARSLRPVRVWLWVIAALVFAMILLGGATRLTGSGLSITEWQPIIGTIPPLSDAAWQEAFDKYRQIPQYQLVNKGMSLDAFKTIFWWEWAHRFLGRVVGIVFLIPFLVFLVQGRIPTPYVGRLLVLFALGGLQGALGWYMVKSGLSGRVDVSQYRLAAHLGMAVLIAGYAIWLALSLNDKRHDNEAREPADRWFADPVVVTAALLVGAIYLQIILGAFVAGLKAGHASYSWPLMNGAIIPYGLNALSPWYLNLFENPLAVHFTHRMMGYFVVAIAVAALFAAYRQRITSFTASINLVIAAVVLQMALGIATVVYEVPLGFALAHQANAFIVFALALWHCHRALQMQHGLAILAS